MDLITPATLSKTGQSITISYIEPGNPQQNAYIERHDRIMHFDWLNQELFTDLDQVLQQDEDWLYHYSHERPNIGDGGFTPMQKLNHAAEFYLISAL